MTRRRPSGHCAWPSTESLHRDTGAILADEDTGLRIHTFVTHLHQLNYFGFKKTLTAAAGLPLLLLVFTGLVMWARPRLRRARHARFERTRGP